MIKHKKGGALLYSILIIFLIFMLAMAIINISEGQLNLNSSKRRFLQKVELTDLGINIGISYLTTLINSTPNIIPDTNKINSDRFGPNPNTTNRTVNIGNYRIRTIIFDQDVVNFYNNNTNQLIQDLINGGINSISEKDNTNHPEGPPYLIISEVTTNTGSPLYKIAITDLENFNRFAYFTNVELTPLGNQIWFLVGRDQLTGPVRTNSNIVRWAIPTDYYTNNSYIKPTFKGTFTFTGNKQYYTSEPPSSTGGIRLLNTVTVPDTEAKLSQIIEGGSSKFKGNADKINLTSSITSEDTVKKKVWPR